MLEYMELEVKNQEVALLLIEWQYGGILDVVF